MRRVKVQASKTNKDRWINQAEGDAQAIKGEPNLSIWRLLPTYQTFIPFVCLASDLIPIVSTGICTPPEASIPESHPTSVSPRQTVNLFQRNKTQLVTSQFTFKRILHKQSIKISPYWKQCNVLEWFVLENDRPNPLFYVPCVFLWLGFDLKGKSLYLPTMWKIYIFCIVFSC